jgi:hypothetical protein
MAVKLHEGLEKLRIPEPQRTWIVGLLDDLVRERNALRKACEWHPGEPEERGFYLARVGSYYHVLHHLGDDRGWTVKMDEAQPDVLEWQHLPDWTKV